ncbi:YfiR family protein [Tsuneonella sp. CC-YZS046]|uniref:YfiR family protein n=1 Tax=Tsuneonella sp. CC-YZS046 TaxID=3042152 RepID=UPI002D77208A|nr:YfiR family protein [Tsuneonella sp. CC-YZS046]WRO66669.1 YfiR family protein [Tsuneonella sp. CC-YZS046]
MKRWFLLLAAPLLICATNGITPVAVPVGSDAARATAHLVKSVLEYTRWPKRREVINLCVVGEARFGEGFPHASLDNGVPIRRRSFTQFDSAAASACDALYLGKIELGRARQWNALVRGTPVVTIAEHDPQCISEAMICLIYGRNSLSFELNVDAVARSKVRIDPRIFRMARGL